jgi:hypothetical protein
MTSWSNRRICYWLIQCEHVAVEPIVRVISGGTAKNENYFDVFGVEPMHTIHCPC